MPTKKLPATANPVVKKAVSKKTSDKNKDGLPLSVVIRKRIESQKARFHANDNISAFIKPGELEGLVDEVAEKMQAVLESLVIDTEHDHNTHDTARRVAKMLVLETFSGRYLPKPKITAFPNVTEYDQVYVTGPITIRSTCAHHFQAIKGNHEASFFLSFDRAVIFHRG